MNFATIDLDADTVAFWAEVRAFFDEHVTDEVLENERLHGGGFDEGLHLAMGQRGWVAPRWAPEDGGAGLDGRKASIISRELGRSGAPTILTTTTLLPPVAIRMFANDEVKAEVLPKVADGTVRVCLGYTEPDCGSDLAAVRTRAERDGDEWLINGTKMFTTGAQFCQYCFLLARTDPELPKHKGLTVFLVPLDLPGIEIRPVETLGGERTNFVYLEDVRVADKYRLGAVNDGWNVVSAPLKHEHGMGDSDGASGNAAHAGSAIKPSSRRKSYPATLSGTMPAIASDTGAVVMPIPAATIRRHRSSLSLRRAKRGRTPCRVKKRLVASRNSHERRAIIVSAASSS
ncbi:MAG TPA: acyl-CoA dehydrogenase family protein, partial [Ilumatobacteraceae bacterium]|nr:acyl-CoA dehydrogenase family protein [Ilumatobacteraceae bacterium]